MKISEISTVIRLLLRSFRLICATTQPSVQDRNSTMPDTVRISRMPPSTDCREKDAMHQ